MVLAFGLCALTTVIIAGLSGYLIGSKVPDFQERAIAYAYNKKHEDCVNK